MVRFDALLLTVLLVIVIASAMGVVTSQQTARKLVVALNYERTREDALNVEWTKLQLEQSTWAEHGRIETLAKEALKMFYPKSGQIIVVEEK